MDLNSAELRSPTKETKRFRVDGYALVSSEPGKNRMNEEGQYGYSTLSTLYIENGHISSEWAREMFCYLRFLFAGLRALLLLGM